MMTVFKNWLANLAGIGPCEPVWASSSHHQLEGCTLLTREKVQVLDCCFYMPHSLAFTLFPLISSHHNLNNHHANLSFKKLFQKLCFWRMGSGGVATIYASAATLLMLLFSSSSMTSIDSNDHFSFLILLESLNSTFFPQKISSFGSVLPHTP